MNTSRGSVRGFSINSLPVYAGGYANGSSRGSVEQYNPNSDSFENIHSLPSARWQDAQCGNGSIGLCFGGWVNDGLGEYASSSALKYSNESWSTIAGMPYSEEWYYNEYDYPGSFSVQFNKAYIKRMAKDKWVTGVSKSRHLNSYDVDSDSYQVLGANNRAENDVASTAGQVGGPSWML